MGDTRSPEELAGGYIRVYLGESTLRLPTLKISAERAWRDRLIQTVAERGVSVDIGKLRSGDEAQFREALVPLLDLGMDVIVTLVIAYDGGNVLGGRAAIEDTMDTAQMYGLLRQILHVVFPFVDDLRGAVAEVLNLMRLGDTLVPSTSSSNTNGHGPVGEPTPIGSSEPSTVSS